MRLIEKLLKKNGFYIFFQDIFIILFLKIFFLNQNVKFLIFLKFKRNLIIIDVGSSDGSFSKNLSRKIL